MKNLNIPFEDREYNFLLKAKGSKPWKQAILEKFGWKKGEKK